MKDSNIEIPQGKMTKIKTLMDIIKLLDFHKQYIIDDITKWKRHDVLLVPPYYCVLNPIELVWSTLKDAVRRDNTWLKQRTVPDRRGFCTVLGSVDWMKFYLLRSYVQFVFSKLIIIAGN